MPETVFKVITEFEAENTQAIKNVVDYELELRRLQKREAELLAGKTKLTLAESRELITNQKRIAQLKGLIGQENKLITTNTRFIKNLKLSNKELLNKEKRMGTLARAINNVIGRTLGLDVNIRQLTTSVGRAALKLTALLAIFIAIRDALNRVAVFRDFFRDFFTAISVGAGTASKALGEFFRGNLNGFRNLRKTYEEAIKLTNELRNAELKNNVAREEGISTINRLENNLAELIRKRRELTQIEQTDQTSRERFNLINDELDLRREILAIQLADVQRRKESVRQQIALDILLGKDLTTTNLENQIKLQGILNEEIRLRGEFDKTNTELSNDQIQIAQEAIKLERERNKLNNQFTQDSINRLRGLLDAAPENEQAVAARTVLLLKETINIRKQDAAIALQLLADDRKRLEIQGDLKGAQELSNKELEIGKQLIQDILELEDQIINLQLGPQATLGGIDRFIANLNRDFGNALTQVDTDIKNQIAEKLKVGKNLEKAFREGDDSLLRNTQALIGPLKRTLEKELFDVITIVNNAQDELSKLTGDELFSAAGVALQQTVVQGGELIKQLKDEILSLKNQLAALGVETEVRSREETKRKLNELAGALEGAGSIFSTLGSSSQEQFDKQEEQINKQIELVDRLKDTILESNADIIKSEEEKLSRLIEGRRKYANQIRDFARLEFIANTAAAIAQAAASGPLGIAQVFGLVAAVLSGLAQLQSAAVFHEGIESVGDNNKVNLFGRKLKRDEVPSILQKKERVLSVPQNARIKHLSNWELVKAGELYSQGFARIASKENRYEQSNNKLLKNIDEKIGALGFHVNMDQKGFSAGLYQFMNRQNKIKSLRK